MLERDQLDAPETSQAPIHNGGRHRFWPLIAAGTSLLLAIACAQPVSDPTPTSESTAVVAGATPETPVVSPITVTDFSFKPINPNEIGINFCTSGRPVGTTLRVSIYRDSNIDPSVKIDSLDSSKWEAIKELGVPCFNTNPSNPDGPILRTENLATGNYLIRAQARPAEANGNWNDRTVRTEYKIYTLRKP